MTGLPEYENVSLLTHLWKQSEIDCLHYTERM
jgi:hypothetical protein